ncbi:Uncharacterised protein [Candidatus Anstonella stagnisolia]|nr:Uncharacterised protein [Candidatus Anstonella stagnisolia]
MFLPTEKSSSIVYLRKTSNGEEQHTAPASSIRRMHKTPYGWNLDVAKPEGGTERLQLNTHTGNRIFFFKLMAAVDSYQEKKADFENNGPNPLGLVSLKAQAADEIEHITTAQIPPLLEESVQASTLLYRTRNFILGFLTGIAGVLALKDAAAQGFSLRSLISPILIGLAAAWAFSTVRKGFSKLLNVQNNINEALKELGILKQE